MIKKFELSENGPGYPTNSTRCDLKDNAPVYWNDCEMPVPFGYFMKLDGRNVDRVLNLQNPGENPEMIRPEEPAFEYLPIQPIHRTDLRSDMIFAATD